MINFNFSKENKNEHNLNWSQIPDHLYRILIFGDSGSGNTNSLFNLIIQQADIDKIYLYVKDPFEAKYQFLVNKRESIGIKYYNDYKALTEYSIVMDDIHKNIEEYHSYKKSKILMVFDDVINDMLNNKKLNRIVAELFIKGRKVKICCKTKILFSY